MSEVSTEDSARENNQRIAYPMNMPDESGSENVSSALGENREKELRESIYNFVADKGGGVSFVEIADEFGEGDSSIIIGENIVIWSGIPFDVCDSIMHLYNTDRLVFLSVSPIMYYVDGRALNLPIAKKRPENGWKTPHWAPVWINTDEQMRGVNE